VEAQVGVDDSFVAVITQPDGSYPLLYAITAKQGEYQKSTNNGTWARVRNIVDGAVPNESSSLGDVKGQYR
jgi:hypothetical protein